MIRATGMYKLRSVTFTIVLLLALQAGMVYAVPRDAAHHSLTWSNNDGIPNIEHEPIYKFDGKIYSADQVELFQVPVMRLDSHSVLDIYLPDESKVDDPAFLMPLAPGEMLRFWIRAGVRIIYHYHGQVLPRRLLIFHLRRVNDDLNSADISLDGRHFGMGMSAFDKLEKLRWKPRTILDIRIINEYPNYPQLPLVGLLSSFGRKLDESNVKRNGWTEEFTDDRDPWVQK